MSYISINTPVDEVERERLLRAQEAGQILYNTIPNGRTSESGSIIIPEDNRACCGIMSPVRRTFCLVVLFDLLLSFILWVIYTQIIDIKPLSKAFIEEVGHYSFNVSLFDSVMVAAFRFTPLQLAYALFRINNPSVVAITTAGTCVYLLAKIFIYHFENRYLGYAVLVVSFVLAWAEAWFLDFKVLPREKKARERESLGGYQNAVQVPSFQGGQGNVGTSQQDPFYSPVESEDEDHQGYNSLQGSRGHSRNHSRSSLALSLGGEEKEYLRLASIALEDVWEMYTVQKGWKLEAGVEGDFEVGFVHAKFVDKHKRRVFRLQGYIDSPPLDVYNDMVTQLPDSPKWNKTVLEAKTLLVISDNCDVVYTVAAEGAGGLVSSRDFVSVRTWEKKTGQICDRKYVCQICSQAGKQETCKG